ncbi:hypothetical protein V2O64_25335 (plasmid) [Verrucomicrobiaceae bacterium 227]
MQDPAAANALTNSSLPAGVAGNDANNTFTISRSVERELSPPAP